MFVKGSPFEAKQFYRSVLKRCVCVIETENTVSEIIVTGLYRGGDGLWIQGVNVSGVLSGDTEDRVSNIVINLDKVNSVEFLARTVYDLDMLTGVEAAGIMQRSDGIVRAAKEFLGPQTN